MHFLGHERCVHRLASLLQFASSYREGRQWSCDCNHCRFMGGILNYLAHHWTRGDVNFAISGGRWSSGTLWTAQNGDDEDRCDFRTYGPHVDIDLVSRALKERRKFDGAARALGKGAQRFNLVPVVDGYMRCLWANYIGWRKKNPLPKRGGPRAALLEIARRRRQASAGREPGSLGLVGGIWKVEPAARDCPPAATADSRRRAGRNRRGAIGNRGTKNYRRTPVDE